jgi:hypothetical protein
MSFVKSQSITGGSIAVLLSKEGASIQSIGHNHPGATPPSGYTGNLSAGVPNGKNEGDYDAYMKIGGRSVESFVYSSQKNWIYNYDKTGYVGLSSSVGF